MATEAAIQRWDKILGEVEKTRKGCPFVHFLVPGYHQFRQAFPLLVDAITKAFRDAWQSDRPTKGSELHAVLEPVARAADDWDFEQPASPQVDKFMGVVAEARRRLADDDVSDATAKEVIADLENLLKVTVLVARVGHHGAMQIADKERYERTRAINKAADRGAKFLDLNTMRWVDRPSKTTLSLATFLAMVEPGMGTIREALGAPDDKDQPEIMKQFAAQWVVTVYTEWEECFRGALAQSLGCKKEDIRSDYFADLGRMRQDYVHKARGICKNSARNRVLKWFDKGNNMIPTHANYQQLLTDFPTEELLTAKPAPTAAQRQPVKANADPGLVRQFEEVADHVGISKDTALDQALSAWIAEHSGKGS
jgi:hypothetical protein